MLDYVYGHDEIIAQFVAAQIPSVRGLGLPGKLKSIGIVEGNELIAGLIYYNWNPDAGIIELSCAALPGRNWLTRETLKRAFQYPFHTCGCQMVYALAAEDNVPMLRIGAALNLAFIRVPRLMGRDKDAVLCTLTVEDWTTSKFCQRFKHHIPDEQLREAA